MLNKIKMGIYAIKPKFQKSLTPVEKLFVKNKVHPTIINLLALLLSVIGGLVLFFSDKNIWLLIYIPFMSFIRTALNALDGMVARELKVKNRGFGEVLNEFFDRISDAIIFFGLALASYTNLILGSAVTIVILLNSYLSIVSKAAGGKRQYGGVMGKADRMIYLGMMAVLILIWKDYIFANYLLIFIGIGTLITMFQRFMSVKRELYK
ncbi:MAG: CDP-alcohol phosphatidyltransferase family protein [bacterium]|nr:CDP-alcohol phosphatidyltransferase family protein [bacterium]